MKLNIRRSLAICAFAFTSLVHAQVVWNFGTTTGNASPSSNTLLNATVSSISQFNNNGSTTMLSTTSASTGYSGVSGQYNAAASVVSGSSLNLSSSTAFQFTVTPAEGYTLSITNITLATRSTASGPALISIRSSLDNFASDLVSASSSGTWSLISPSSFSTITSTSAVTFRIYGYNATGAAGTANWRIDDLTISGSASLSAVPEPSTYAAFAGLSALVFAATRRRRRP